MTRTKGRWLWAETPSFSRKICLFKSYMQITRRFWF